MISKMHPSHPINMTIDNTFLNMNSAIWTYICAVMSLFAHVCKYRQEIFNTKINILKLKFDNLTILKACTKMSGNL